MKTMRGDLIALAESGRFDVIVHGCNCFCTMGAGIARGIKSAFPDAFEADCATPSGWRDKLGTCSVSLCQTAHGQLWVVNAYTQYKPTGPLPLVDEEAVRTCFAWVAQRFATARIGIPKIGAGLAGGDWSRLAPMIEREMTGRDLTLVIYEPASPGGGQ